MAGQPWGRIGRLMHRHGGTARRPQAFRVCTTDSNHPQHSQTRDQARWELFVYIESYHNRARLQGYITPDLAVATARRLFDEIERLWNRRLD